MTSQQRRAIIKAIATGNRRVLAETLNKDDRVFEYWNVDDGMFIKQGDAKQLSESDFDQLCNQSGTTKLIFLSVENMTDSQLEKYSA